MLSEFEQVEATFGAEKATDLRKACRYLLRNQFAYSGDRGAATVYNTLTDARFRRVADELFDSLGYRVHRNAEEQWVGILLDDDDPSSVPRLKLDETIVVLVLGSHWQEEADLGNLLDRATALTTVNVLHERYRDLVQAAGKPAIPAARFLDLLREAEARKLIAIGDLDRDAQDREVEIRPMIKLVSGSDALNRLESYVKAEEALVRRPSGAALMAALSSDTDTGHEEDA
ncbi:hypothetical protein DC522_21675 [Microvirga sp. KLBC 81]|uniref:DUF4194 domain-containing protein n=1 Tax=Microvirga sp. KLBC 81 TaxID=1862707 RepID=UPI000D514397|nr:DUF4194 domain-containing protein [Microvirga sp. KLBC 81]PVE22388.1 hypothetical protein DC522_21675 [Microvirga sp. KLBC 81]